MISRWFSSDPYHELEHLYTIYDYFTLQFYSVKLTCYAGKTNFIAHIREALSCFTTRYEVNIDADGKSHYPQCYSLLLAGHLNGMSIHTCTSEQSRSSRKAASRLCGSATGSTSALIADRSNCCCHQSTRHTVPRLLEVAGVLPQHTPPQTAAGITVNNADVQSRCWLAALASTRSVSAEWESPACN